MVLAAQLWRDYVTDGVPASGVNNPFKSDARTWGTGLENGLAGVHAADIPSATTTDLSGAAGELVDVTGTATITAITLADGNVCTVRFTGALTLTNGASLVLPGGANILTVAGDFAIFRGYSGSVVRCVAYQRNDGKSLVSASVGTLVGAGQIINATLVESHAANAVTYSLKTLAGADPSSGDPVKAYFRSSTPGSGAYAELVIAAALSLTVSSGSTLGVPGTGAANAFKPWLVIFNDAGTPRIGIINCRSGNNIYPLGQFPIASSTAEGGAGAADSAQVFYTGTAVSSKPYIPLGYASYESGLATLAGTWDASPTRIQIFGPGVPLPGTRIQQAYGQLTGTDSTANTYALSNTAPVAANGKAFASCALQPTSAANLIKVRGQVNGAAGTSTATFGGFITSSSGPTTLTTTFLGAAPAGGNILMTVSMQWQGLAASTSSITYTGYFASNTATVYINGISSGAELGGTSVSFVEAEEIMT